MTKKTDKPSPPPGQLSVEQQRRRVEEEERKEKLKTSASREADEEESSAREPRRRAKRVKKHSKLGAFERWGRLRAPELTHEIDEGLRYLEQPEAVLLTIADASVSSLGGTIQSGMLKFIQKEGVAKIALATKSFRDKIEESGHGFLHPKYVGRALLEMKAIASTAAKTRIEIAAFFHEPPASKVITDRVDKDVVAECFKSGKGVPSDTTLKNKASDLLYDPLEVLLAVQLVRHNEFLRGGEPTIKNSYLVHPAMHIFRDWPEWEAR